MSTVNDIYLALDSLAPFSLTMDFDNTGILIGNKNKAVHRALLALDCTAEVVSEALCIGAELIITHHPVIFHAIKRINEDSLPFLLLENGLAVISSHTNLDLADGGVNDVLAASLGLGSLRGLERQNGLGADVFLGRVGELPQALSPMELASFVKERLGALSVKFCDGGRLIKTLAVCGGSGASCLSSAIDAGADALLTGDVKHDQFILATAAAITLLDAGHFNTEDVVIDSLCSRLQGLVPDVTFSATHASSIREV